MNANNFDHACTRVNAEASDFLADQIDALAQITEGRISALSDLKNDGQHGTYDIVLDYLERARNVLKDLDSDGKSRDFTKSQRPIMPLVLARVVTQ